VHEFDADAEIDGIGRITADGLAGEHGDDRTNALATGEGHVSHLLGERIGLDAANHLLQPVLDELPTAFEHLHGPSLGSDQASR